MITISDSLRPDCVLLDLEAREYLDAIRSVALLLKPRPEVLDWKGLLASMNEACPCIVDQTGEFSLCLPHARTDAVNAIVMSVGRFRPGLMFPATEAPVRYIFCIGAPKALASDYPRIVGLLSRIFQEPESEAQLCAATTPSEFIARLSALEAKL